MALNHVFNKPEKIVNTGLGMLEAELTVPNLFQKEEFAQYAGAKNGTVNVEVEGLLPFREWAFRSGEGHIDTESPYTGGAPSNTVRQKIEFDKYVERTLPLTLGGAVYSAVEVTDEQMTYDLGTWTDKIANKQIRAIGRGLQHRAIQRVVNAPYEVALGDLITVEGGALKGVTEARRVLNAFNAPAEGRVLLVGTDFETALGNDSNVKFASQGGDSVAETALREATLGRLKGFTVVVSNDIPAGDAYAFYKSAFVMATAAPVVPQSVKHGASASFEGLAMRWITDYSADWGVDRSVFTAYAGFREITDLLTYFDDNGIEHVTDGAHFVRGIKLQLDGATNYPEAGSELASATGVHTGPSKILFPANAEGVEAAPSTPAND